GRGGAEPAQLYCGCTLQNRARAGVLCGDQCGAFLMDNVDDGAPPEQILIPCVLADIGAALPRGLIAHLITDGVAEIARDGELVRRAPRRCRRDLCRPVVSVTDPAALDGDRAEEGLERKGA